MQVRPYACLRVANLYVVTFFLKKKKDTGVIYFACLWLGLVLNGWSSYRQAVLIGLKDVSNKYPEPGAQVF